MTDDLADIFYGFWWLMFPMAWFLLAGWRSWLRELNRRQAMDLAKAYADAGKAPPAGLSL